MPRERFSPGPLGDLRVLEVGGEAGEWCGKLFADLGADVIKVEPPGGAPEREIGPFYEDRPDADRSLHFWHYNTSKRGITLNLETEDGRAVFRRLVVTADVLLESLPAGTMPALGLGYDALHDLQPALVMCSLTPFGQHGPWRDYQSSDLIHLAAGGQAGESGYEDADVPGAPPIAAGGGNAWHTGSHYAYIAIMAALMYRGLYGGGQYIDASVHAALALTTEGGVPTWLFNREVRKRQTGRHAAPQPTPRAQFLCADDRYVNTLMFGMRMTPQQLQVIAAWFAEHGQADDLQAPEYADAATVTARMPHILEVAERFMRSQPSDVIYHGAQQRGFPLGPVRSPDEVLADEHFRDRGFFVEVEHPELGRSFTYPGAAAIYNGSPWRVSRRAPLLGEDNRAVFAEVGLTDLEQAALRETGAI